MTSFISGLGACELFQQKLIFVNCINQIALMNKPLSYKSITTSNYTFEDVITGGDLYVDKTDFFHQLVSINKGIFFLSRPRRFGKSLSVSILKNIFKGNKELFKGLKIYDMPYDWKDYPVINLNISIAPCESAVSLNEGLCGLLRENADTLGIELSEQTHSGMLFTELIRKTKAKGKIVILIDEYDKPLVENIYAPHLEEVRQVLEDFYINIKASDEHLRFVFMTGVTKFSKVSIFSKLNNLRDITMSEQFATMYGYTQEELEHYFGDRIDELADKNKIDKSEYRNNIKRWYNGFRFHKDATTVYNPVSMGMFMNEGGQFINYWFSTGSPSFIFKVIKKQDIDFFDLIHQGVSYDLLDSFDVANMQAAPLLLQTGYLTIERSEMMMGQPIYYLNFPNLEIETAFEKHLISLIAERNLGEVTSEIIKMQKALYFNNTAELHQLLYSHIAAIPYAHRSHMEENYQNILFSIFRLLGADIHNEVHMNKGRIDSVIVNHNHTYLFELKMDQKADIALTQIKENGYAKPYLNTGKPITIIGINFSRKKRNIIEWKEEIL
jgi:Predicted AAA-ATPase/PD-(D/E)XK nuclease superfamily